MMFVINLLENLGMFQLNIQAASASGSLSELKKVRFCVCSVARRWI